MKNFCTKLFVDALRKDIKRNFPKGLRSFVNLFTNPGIISIIIYRYLHAVSKMNPAFLRVICLVPGKIVEKIWSDLYGIQISRHANIGGGFKIAHFSGIFINSEVQIGDNVTVCQGTTIGIWGGTKNGAPFIGNNVYIGPGAKLFGKITISNNVRIGANAVVFFDVPDNATVYSPEAKVKIRGNGE